jgi:GntR family transcriptional regulator, uxu operon transcriptional repressor
MALASSVDNSSFVREHLARLIASGTYEVGTKLPTERALADQLLVPRGAIRDALAVLEWQGVVVRRVGSGTFVERVSDVGAANTSSAHAFDASPAEIMAGRLIFEPKVAGIAVANATMADFERLDACNRSAESATTFEEFEHWDAALHQGIADATHNRLVVEIFATITRARDHADWGEMKRRSLTPERRARYEIEHRGIVAALRARDATLAEARLSEHLQGVRLNVLGL